MAIRIFTTGGTIEGYANIDVEDGSQEPQIQRLLNKARITEKPILEQLFEKDSKKLTTEDRTILLEKCQSCEEEKILISHGTDAMTETAMFLGPHVKNKTVILVGAMLPAFDPNSDAEFNVGAAIMALSLQPHGVYVAMHGRLFDWDNVQKNFATKYFEEIR